MRGRLDKLLEMESKRKSTRIILVSATWILVLLFLVAAIEAFMTGEVIEVQGVAKSIHSEVSLEFGEHFYVFVEVETGESFLMQIPREVR